MAQVYEIEPYINTSYLLKSPSQNYALISYLDENGYLLVDNGKLNPVFSYQPGVLKKKYGIDLNELINKYPLDIEKFKKNEGKKI